MSHSEPSLKSLIQRIVGGCPKPTYGTVFRDHLRLGAVHGLVKSAFIAVLRCKSPSVRSRTGVAISMSAMAKRRDLTDIDEASIFQKGLANLSYLHIM